MTFNKVINDIMPYVKDGSEEPFIVYRNINGNWQIDFTKNQYGERYDWIDDIKIFDPFAYEFTGKDFSDGSFAYVHDTVLSTRLRLEYELNLESGMYSGKTFEEQVLGIDENEARALINFFEDNAVAFSNKAINYLISANRPFTALTEMYPYNIEAKDDNSSYNEDLAKEAVNHIEKEIQKRLGLNRDKLPNKTIVDGYEAIHNIKLGGKEIIVGEKSKDINLYMICDMKRDNTFRIEEYSNITICDDYINAMRMFSQRIEKVASELSSNRNKTGLPERPLTTSDCLPDSKHSDWDGKLIIINPEMLAPEYRSMEHQLVLCTGGFGADPNARGRAVHVKELFNGNHLRYDRHQIAGIVNTDKIPKWALNKIINKLDENEIKNAGLSSIQPDKEKPAISKKNPTLAYKLENAKDKARKSDKNITNKTKTTKKHKDTGGR